MATREGKKAQMPAPGRSVDRGAPSHTRFVLSPTAGRLTDYYNHNNNSSTYPPDTAALLTWLVPLIHRSELLEAPLFCSQENHSLGGVSDIPKVTQDLSCKAHSSYPLRHSLLPWGVCRARNRPSSPAHLPRGVTGVLPAMVKIERPSHEPNVVSRPAFPPRDSPSIDLHTIAVPPSILSCQPSAQNLLLSLLHSCIQSNTCLLSFCHMPCTMP